MNEMLRFSKHVETYSWEAENPQEPPIKKMALKETLFRILRIENSIEETHRPQSSLRGFTLFPGIQNVGVI